MNKKHQSVAWKLSAISSAVATVIAGMNSPVTFAATQTLTGTQSSTIANGVTVNGINTTAIYVDNAATGVSINNSGTVSASSSSAIYVNNNATNTTILNNASGVISANGSYSAIYFQGNIDGSITNAGQIISNGSNYAAGIYTSNDLTGKIINSGSVSATASSSSYATAYGIYVNNNLSGSITNTATGLISVSASATSNSSNAYAYGIYVGNDLTGSITNDGTIKIIENTTTNGSRAYGYGIYVNSNVNGSIVNNGTISLDIKSNTDPEAYGIYVGSDLTGSIVNKGTININEISTSSDLYAYGVYVGGNAAGTIVNSGTINLTLNPLSYVYTGAGIYVNNDVTSIGSITNSGTITINANAQGYEASAYGIYVGGSNQGQITNTGNISVLASARERANAYGMYVNNNLGAGAKLSNSGTITATANTFSSSRAYAYGMYVGSSADGTITNTGNINASASAATDNASAFGIYANTLTGSIVNSGTITATSNSLTNTGSAYAYGIYTNNLTGSITNSGVIKATAPNDSNAYSIYSNGGTGTVNNLASGVLDGHVYLAAANLNNDGDIRTRLSSSIVGGNYTQSATGVFTLAALDAVTYGTLQVSGTATLDPNSTIRVFGRAGNTIAAGDVLTNAISAGTLAMPTPVKVQDNILAVNFASVNNGANGVDLVATATGLTTVVASVQAAGLSSATGVGSVLDTLLVDPEAYSPEVTNYLYTLGASNSSQEVANKAAQLLPLVSGNISNSTLNTLRLTNLAVGERQNENVGASSGDLTLTNKHFWLKPFGSWANQDKRSGTLGYGADTAGLIVGADGDLSEGKNVGLAFAYARTNVDSDTVSQDANIKSYQGTFYGSYKLDDTTNLNYQADFGYHDTNGKRNIVGVGSAKSSYDSWSGHAGVSLAKRLDLDEITTFTPSLRADYSRIRAEGYREKGAGAFNLKVGSDATDELILGVDGKLARKLSDKATAYANIGVGYDVINDRTSITSSFAGIPNATFTTKGIDPSPWLVRGGLGITGQASETLELSARYDFEVKKDFDNQTASVNARWAF